MIRMLLVCGALLLSAAAPPPPAVLAPYVRDGAFEPGDYGWLRGRFADATAAERARWDEVRAWQDACVAGAQAEVRAELVAMGIADPQVPPATYGEQLCSDVTSANVYGERPSFAAFAADLEQARPIADAFLFAQRVAVAHGRPRGPTLADRLLAMPLGEQVLRTGLGWGEGEAGRDAPPLTPGVRAIVLSRLTTAMMRADAENMARMKRIVDAEGWPDQRTVGEPAAHAAWLIVQHADADPAFQLRVLRLMEPMLASGGVSRRSYAYLYDRVMLKLAGRQRYGTQAMCRGGIRMAQPLEEGARVDALRAEAGLEPVAEYLAMMDRDFGPCPTDRPR